jgi:uncharacterized protein (TIGR03435 family)
MTGNTSLGLLMSLAAIAASAEGQEVRPAYEVATIKLNPSASANRGVKEDTQQVTFTSVPLKRLIAWAYKVYEFQLIGPGWLDNTYVDISAKYPPDTKDEQRHLMLRTLLEDRLKLEVHRESRPMQGYALVIGKKGFKLTPAVPDAPSTPGFGSISPALNLQGGLRRSTVVAKKASMASLADLVTRIWDQMVVDNTGLPGVYDFELRWNNDLLNAASGEADSFPPLSTAVEDTLGLRLEAKKIPVEVIVVDHVERVPTGN